MDLETLYALMPENWTAVVGAVLTALIALRTLLRACVAVFSAIDVALDGESNWHWVGKLGDFLDKVDGYLDRLPVKAPIVRSK